MTTVYYPEDMWLWEELENLEAQMDAEGVTDATSWERFPEYEGVLCILAERAAWRESYPYEQYKRDRAAAIADGTDPRCIMSYAECLAYDEFERWERQQDEVWEAYDEVCGFDADVIAEAVEAAEEAAIHEIREFGFPAGEFDERVCSDAEYAAFCGFAEDYGGTILIESLQ